MVRTETLGLRQTLRNHVADNHYRRAQKVAEAAQANPPVQRLQHKPPILFHARRHRAMVSGGENIRQHGQIFDLAMALSLSGT